MNWLWRIIDKLCCYHWFEIDYDKPARACLHTKYKCVRCGKIKWFGDGDIINWK